MNSNAALIAFVLLLAASGCLLGAPPSQSVESDESSTGTAIPASTSTSGAASTSEIPQPTTSGESSSNASTSTIDSSSSALFIQPADHNSVEPCNPYMQECPTGQKCMPYADDGGDSWNNTKCVSIMENPAGVGDPCFVVDGAVSGVDNCELGAMCWNIDAENTGECIVLCTGSADAPICPQDHSCIDNRNNWFGLCVADCDPIAQDCDPDEVCLPNPIGVGFNCTLDASGRAGQALDPCMFANACDPGLWCVDVTSAKECDQNQNGCCEPFCDITAPNTCTGEGQVCVTIYDGDPDPEHENVGYCSLPI